MTYPQGYPEPGRRLLITLAALIAVMMHTIDTTIAIIALPNIQSSLVASQEQIAWVLTSYLIASAIFTALAGWLADRFGRIRVMIVSVFFFTLASVGCGVAANLEMLVLCRFIQGAAGASLVPLAQILLMEIYPPEKHASAIAMFGTGTLFGPMIGPTLGGWLTENVSWRSIFLINAPLGVISCIGLIVFARDRAGNRDHPFDLRGFAMLTIAITSFQLMLDRGQLLDWFASTEICIEAAIAGVFGYLMVVHMVLTPKAFIDPTIFRDRNFLVGTLLSAIIGILLNGVIPIVTSMMQHLLGYPVMLAGWLSLPRAFGNILTIMLCGRFVARFGPRRIILCGMAMLVLSMWMLTGISLDARQETLGIVAFLQGCGSGFLFMPLLLVVFSTLPHHQRNVGSTLFALVRNVAGAAGISVIQAMTIRGSAEAQSRLVEHVRPDNPMVALGMPDFDPSSTLSVAAMMGQVVRQAQMLAYVDVFRAILVLAVVMSPLCLLLRGNPSADAARLRDLHAE